MNKILLTGLVLVCGVGCGASTIIGSADGGCGVSYPKNGFNGPNILYPGATSFVGQPGPNPVYPPMYEIVAVHPSLSETVQLNMTLLAGSVWYVGSPLNDWHFTLYDAATGKQTFVTPNVTGESETSIYLIGNGRALLELFECGSTTPTSSKTITWSVSDGGAPLGDGSAPDGSADDGGAPGLDGGASGSDGGILGLDGGILGLDGGAPRLDGGAPGLDGGARRLDGGTGNARD